MTDSAPFILPYDGISPFFASVWERAGRGSAVLGRATLGAGANLGAHSVIRADGHFIRIGDEFHLGPHSTLHIAHGRFPCIVGNRVTVGRNTCVHACTVGDDVVIGDDCAILDGAIVENNVVIEAGSAVFPGSSIASGFLYRGSPAKPLRELSEGEMQAHARAVIQSNLLDLKEQPAVGGVPAPQLMFHPAAFAAKTAELSGSIEAAEEASIWFGTVLDAGAGRIEIGFRSNVQDNTNVRCRNSRVVRIGEKTTVGHNVTLIDCTIGNASLIGTGSVVTEGCVVEDNVLLAANAKTEEGQILETGWLWGGNPARPMRKLDDAKFQMISTISFGYAEYAKAYKALQG